MPSRVCRPTRSSSCPNNKNIVMTANQAREVTVKKLQVVPSKSIAQGLAAMLVHDPNGDLAAVASKMEAALKTVKTGEITVATRACLIDGVRAESGQAIGLLDGKLVNAADTVEQAVLDLLKTAKAEEHELITMIHGEDLTGAPGQPDLRRCPQSLPGPGDRDPGRRAAALPVHPFDRVKQPRVRTPAASPILLEMALLHCPFIRSCFFP